MKLPQVSSETVMRIFSASARACATAGDQQRRRQNPHQNLESLDPHSKTSVIERKPLQTSSSVPKLGRLRHKLAGIGRNLS